MLRLACVLQLEGTCLAAYRRHRAQEMEWINTTLSFPTKLGGTLWQKNRFLNVTWTYKVAMSRWTEESTPGFIPCRNTWDYKSTCKGLKWSLPMSQSQALYLQSSERAMTFNTVIFLTLKPTTKTRSFHHNFIITQALLGVTLSPHPTPPTLALCKLKSQ